MQTPQKQRRRTRPAATDGGAPALPPETAHVIVVRGSMRGPAPEDTVDADTVVYEVGDELPLAYARQAFAGWQGRLAALDDSGEHIAGGDGGTSGPLVLTEDASEHLRRSLDVETVIERFEERREGATDEN